MNRRLITTALLILCVLTLQAKKDAVPLYKRADAPVEKRVQDLLKRMTLEEKILQLSQGLLGGNDNANNIMPDDASMTVSPMIGSVIYTSTGPQQRNALQKRAMEETRLGIPVVFGYDVIHGYRTIYPVPLACACTWNPELVRRCCSVAASESRASGVDWTFSPMIDIARDPRWGRVVEGYGEDPYTTSVFAAAAVKGYQGDNPAAPDKVAACLKHFVGYGASEAGRDYVYTEISDQTLWDTYLPPYEAGVKAGAMTVMSAFNNISGIPATANRYTLTDILRRMWGFKGLVVSDWDAVFQLIHQNHASDKADAALKALSAGVDLDMTDNVYQDTLEQLVKEKRLSEDVIDEAVRRVLRVKFELGLFENPFTPDTPAALLTPESVKTAESAAEESMVLLKNEGGILPLKNVGEIALIGPLVTDDFNLMGPWTAHGQSSDVKGLLEAFKEEFGGKAELTYARGCEYSGTTDRSGFTEAIAAAQKADVIIACLGEYNNWTGENASRASIQLPPIQRELLEALDATGKPVVLLLVNGRPLDLSQAIEHADAVLEMWQPGIAGSRPAAGIVSGRINPSGKLAITFPFTIGQIPIYYNRRSPARDPNQGYYQDYPVEPLFPFGSGLSYSSFDYGNIVLSADRVDKDGALEASVTVKNTSERDGMETVHWYIQDPVCSVSRPVKELKHFEKAMIKAGETRTFTFDINVKRDFSFVDRHGSKILEKGDVYIIVKDRKEKVTIE